MLKFNWPVDVSALVDSAITVSEVLVSPGLFVLSIFVFFGFVASVFESGPVIEPSLSKATASL